VADVIRVFSNAQRPTWVARSVADSEGKKTDEGTMMPPPEPKRNPMAVADPPEAETSTAATTKRESDILVNWRIPF
jgi:hypothetical protein